LRPKIYDVPKTLTTTQVEWRF